MKMKQNFRNTRGTSSDKTDHTTSDGQLSNVFRLTLLVDCMLGGKNDHTAKSINKKTLNKRTELFAKCLHKNRFSAGNFNIQSIV